MVKCASDGREAESGEASFREARFGGEAEAGAEVKAGGEAEASGTGERVCEEKKNGFAKTKSKI